MSKKNKKASTPKPGLPARQERNQAELEALWKKSQEELPPPIPAAFIPPVKGSEEHPPASEGMILETFGKEYRLRQTEDGCFVTERSAHGPVTGTIWRGLGKHTNERRARVFFKWATGQPQNEC